MSQPLRLGIAGLGTVGVGVVKLLAEQADMIAARAGRPVRVVAVSARDRRRDRGVDLAAYDWCDNPVDLAQRDDVDVVVELIGGADGPALALAKTAFDRSKAFVTANKALIAHHGTELAERAEAGGAALSFEAAVAGGIPIIKALGEGLAANAIDRVYGILNGTCNYILTRMEAEGLPFEEVLEDAQRLGYAEADPSFDVDGIDTAHKTAILAALAFGLKPDFDAIPIEGIRHIARVDIDYASELGYRIKLLGVARLVDGRLDQRVHPCMIDATSALAGVGGALNAVVVQGHAVGQTVYEGAGAGAGPTASAVVGDVIDVARGRRAPAFGVPARQLQARDPISLADHVGRFYLRLRVLDQPGVIADVTAILRDASVSMASILQRGEAASGGVYVVLTTHQTAESLMRAAVDRMVALDSVLEAPTVLRIEDI